MYLQEHDLLSPDKLSAAVDAAGTEAREARSRYDAAAAKAIAELNGAEYMGRTMVVKEARPRA